MRIILMILLVLLITVQLNAQEKLTFSTFTNKGDAGEISLKILKQAYKLNNITINSKGYPGARALIISDEGKEVDGELFRISGLKKKYPNLIEIPVPLTKFEMYVFTKKHSFKVNGWESLRPYHIGILRGGKFSEKKTVGMNRIIVNSEKQLFLMLDAGKVDIIVRGKSAQKTLDDLPLKNIKMLKKPVGAINLHHYLHKKHKKLVPLITKSLLKMQNEGTIKKINDEMKTKEGKIK